MKRNGLPDRDLLRVSEVAAYFDVGERCVRLWIEHGKLQPVYTPGGAVRVDRKSVLACFYAKVDKKE